MKSKRLYIFFLFLAGVVACSFTLSQTVKPVASVQAGITINSSNSHRGQQPVGDSPFIRFHHGISESNVSVASEHVPVIPQKPVNSIPEKFAGIVGYISSLYLNIPPGEVFLYSRPLRSPPLV